MHNTSADEVEKASAAVTLVKGAGVKTKDQSSASSNINTSYDAIIYLLCLVSTCSYPTIE